MKSFVFAICVIILSTRLSAQEPLSTKSKRAIELYVSADNYRVRGQFDQAIALLIEAIEKDKKFEEAYFRLAVCFRSRGDYQKSIEAFETGLSLTKDSRKQKSYWFQLGDICLKDGDYGRALIHLNNFLMNEKVDRPRIQQVEIWKVQAQYGLDHQQEKYHYEIKPLSDTVNAFPMQYFPTLSADDSELIFTVRYGKDHDDNEDLFLSTKEINGIWKAPVPIEELNSTFREGASTISADGRHIIFTICGPRGCDLFESVKVGSKWKSPVNLGSAVNSAGWEAQPSLSADGNELYFISDRKGGVGGYDIWYSKKDEDGHWQKASNVGAPVNTPFDEIAPYIHFNNQNLYYASNGLPGFGSYDIYVSERKEGSWIEPMNMGAPLNDHHDQYSFTVSSKGDVAYFSKEEGRHQSKIYKTVIPPMLQVKSRGNVVRGKVIDAATKEALKATVELLDIKSGVRVAQFTSDSLTGNYLIVIPGRSEYALHVQRTGYLFKSLHFDYLDNNESKPLILDVALDKILKNSSVVLNNIFFKLNEFELDIRSKTELNKVISYLQQNPAISIEISGHTDNLGTESYNNTLSLKRATSVVQYLIQGGVLSFRLVAVGHGSKYPISPNDSDANRQKNRRIEFRITSF